MNTDRRQHAVLLNHLASVTADTLVPRQHPTPMSLQVSRNFFQQHLIKHPHISDFHSLPKYLHAGLLEAAPAVSSFVPQPFLLRIGRRRYTPACYVVADHSPRRVIELKPRGEMDEALKGVLQAFFAQHNMCFEVISNESVLERRIEAQNWLEIVRILYLGHAMDTQGAENILLDRFASVPEQELGSLIDPGDRDATYLTEIALFRLLHRGVIRADLADQWLDYETKFWMSDHVAQMA